MIILDDPERCGRWAMARIPGVTSWGREYVAIGLEVGGQMRAACVFNHYSGADISAHMAAERLTRPFLRGCFAYPFEQLKCRRISAFVAQRNERAQRFVERLGFRREGLMRDAMPDDHVIVYGMTRAECTYV